MADTFDPGGMRPLLRWPGGKHRFAPELLPLLEDARRQIADEEEPAAYAEPFMGAGGSLLAVCKSGYFSQITAGDKSIPLMFLHVGVRKLPSLVASRAQALPGGVEDHPRVVGAYNGRRKTLGILECQRPNREAAVLRASVYDLAQIGAQLLWLSRSAYGGLYRENDDGLFNASSGLDQPRVPTEKWIRRVSGALEDCRLRCADWVNFLAGSDVLDEKRPLVVYVDPPYQDTTAVYHGEAPSLEKLARRLRAFVDERACQGLATAVLLQNYAPNFRRATCLEKHGWEEVWAGASTSKTGRISSGRAERIWRITGGRRERK